MESESKNNIILDKPVAMRNSEKSADPVRRRSIRTNIRHPRPIFHARITALAPLIHLMPSHLKRAEILRFAWILNIVCASNGATLSSVSF